MQAARPYYPLSYQWYSYYVNNAPIHVFSPCGRIVYHFAWGAMRNRPVLVADAAQRLAELLQRKAQEMQIVLRALEIQADRVYVVVEAPPTVSPHHIVCGLKACSSGPMRQEFKEITAMPTLWTRHYLVATGEGLSASQVLQAFAATQQPRRPRGRPRCAPP